LQKEDYGGGDFKDEGGGRINLHSSIKKGVRPWRKRNRRASLLPTRTKAGKGEGPRKKGANCVKRRISQVRKNIGHGTLTPKKKRGALIQKNLCGRSPRSSKKEENAGGGSCRKSRGKPPAPKIVQKNKELTGSKKKRTKCGSPEAKKENMYSSKKLMHLKIGDGSVQIG